MSCRHNRAFAHSIIRRLGLVAVAIALLLLVPGVSHAEVKRIVVIKVDGLPYDLVEEFVKETDPRTGKSRLPWIDYVFYQRGARLSNFYVRGMSLSAPSWSTVDTGQHLQIKGNVEFDRYTLHAYDYLNFIPFYLKSAAGARIDMPGTEVLDSLHVPLLLDAFPHEQRFVSFQLYQRGMRFSTLKDAMQKRFVRAPRELWDEWTMGLEMRSAFFEQLERELRGKLNDPNIRYLDLYVSEFDHVAHHNRDRQSHMFALQDIDRLIGRIWTAIQQSPLASETAFIVVSDHGFNTDGNVYSQGYNLVKLLGSKAGGGHHVVTKRRLMLEYSIKGINFLVPLINTTTNESFYLKGQSTDYPTALLDFDGNERAAIHLRDSDLNVLHILLQQLQRETLSPAVRTALTKAFFDTIERRRSQSRDNLRGLEEELGVLRRRIADQQKLWDSQPKKFTQEEIVLGKDDDKKRVYAQLERWMAHEKEYTEYARTLTNLLALRSERFQPAKILIPDVIAKNAMGERNSLYELQNYVVGVAPGGFVVKPDGSLDMEKSFQRVDYFSLLNNVTVRNNVQATVSNKPIDMLLTRISSESLKPLLNEDSLARDAVWIYGGPRKQALLLAREDPRGQLSLRFVPIANLRETANNQIQFELQDWAAGFPLHIFEDERLNISGDRAAWLSQWHSEEEWFNALHKTEYSNGLIGIYEQMARHPVPTLNANAAESSVDERLMQRFTLRQRSLTEPDLQMIANNHWNFDVRGFNPGGNHGSFFRISTHSTLMMFGGDRTGIPQNVVVSQPYDTLSFVPTVLALTGKVRNDNNPNPDLRDKGFQHFPGRLIRELLPLNDRTTARTGAIGSH